MDYDFRCSSLDKINKESFAISHLKDIKRTYSMYDIAIMTRSSPAKILGLKDRGSLKKGSIADISIYDPIKPIDSMFREAKYVFKNGEEIVRNGKVLKYKKTSTQCISLNYDNSILKELKKWVERYYTMKIDEFSVDEHFFSLHNFKKH